MERRTFLKLASAFGLGVAVLPALPALGAPGPTELPAPPVPEALSPWIEALEPSLSDVRVMLGDLDLTEHVLDVRVQVSQGYSLERSIMGDVYAPMAPQLLGHKCELMLEASQPDWTDHLYRLITAARPVPLVMEFRAARVRYITEVMVRSETIMASGCGPLLMQVQLDGTGPLTRAPAA